MAVVSNPLRFFSDPETPKFSSLAKKKVNIGCGCERVGCGDRRCCQEGTTRISASCSHHILFQHQGCGAASQPTPRTLVDPALPWGLDTSRWEKQGAEQPADQYSSHLHQSFLFNFWPWNSKSTRV